MYLPSFVRSPSLRDPSRRSPIHRRVLRIEFITFVVNSEAAVIVLESVRLRLKPFGLRAVQVCVAARRHLRLGQRSIVIPPAWQSEATILGTVIVPRYVGIMRTVIDTPRQASVIVRQVAVTVVAYEGTILAVVTLRVGIVVVVVSSVQSGRRLGGDVPFSVLDLPSVYGVSVTAHGGGSIHRREAVWTEGNLAHRSSCDGLNHLGYLRGREREREKNTDIISFWEPP